MTPEIAALLTATYPDLVTVPVADPAERHLPDTFIKYPLFWWIHESYEYKGISPCNEAEAEKVCALAKYLLLHGIEERRITIIAGYQGQVNTFSTRTRTDFNLSYFVMCSGIILHLANFYKSLLIYSNPLSR